MRRLIALTTLATVALLGPLAATPAHATAPERSTIAINDDFVVDPFPGGCTFPIRIQFVGTARNTLFFDAQGNPETLQTHIVVFATFTNTTNGVSISGPVHNEQWVDVPETGLTINGLFNLFTVPGGGVVFLDTGRIIVDEATGRSSSRPDRIKIGTETSPCFAPRSPKGQ
jgi:hypothetical protein